MPGAAELITGGNTSHYWEETGIIGKLYEETLGIEMYAWDVWMIYKPGILWNDESPPEPDYWMHQLGSGIPGSKFDSKEFAEVVDNYLEQISK